MQRAPTTGARLDLDIDHDLNRQSGAQVDAEEWSFSLTKE
jgi:hypothetical protein